MATPSAIRSYSMGGPPPPGVLARTMGASAAALSLLATSGLDDWPMLDAIRQDRDPKRAITLVLKSVKGPAGVKVEVANLVRELSRQAGMPAQIQVQGQAAAIAMGRPVRDVRIVNVGGQGSAPSGSVATPRSEAPGAPGPKRARVDPGASQVGARSVPRPALNPKPKGGPPTPPEGEEKIEAERAKWQGELAKLLRHAPAESRSIHEALASERAQEKLDGLWGPSGPPPSARWYTPCGVCVNG